MSERRIDDTWGIHWFRRDLRMQGNPGLQENWRAHDGRVLGIFCFDQKFLDRPDFSHNRFAFFLSSLKDLQCELRKAGGDLLVVNCAPESAFQSLINYINTNSNRVSKPLMTWNRDYEPYARERDQKIENLFKANGYRFQTYRDHLLIEPHELSKPNSSDFYQVYTPFSKRWLEMSGTDEIRSRIERAIRSANKKSQILERSLFKMKWSELNLPHSLGLSESLELFERKNKEHVTVPIPRAGYVEAQRVFANFLARIEEYESLRDFPSKPATSGLSMFLKNGSINIAQILGEIESRKLTSSIRKFRSELIWREFFYHILWHRPDSEKIEFHDHYRKLEWKNNAQHFECWKKGMTGFPIVDAGMRELLRTGRMHNRVRMIVASFLTKDLLIDWKWGAQHFMQFLLDGDVAANSGGWQWAASTGCDPQPYFRIFNPWLQGKKFDPEGIYIKEHVSELRQFTAKEIHNPNSDLSKFGYPAPIVSHEESRFAALKMFEEIRQKRK